MFWTSGKVRAALGLLALGAIAGGLPRALALDFDWSGQFRAEAHYVRSYAGGSANRLPDATRLAAGGYYIPGGGEDDASFQPLFLRVKPKVIINDNLYLKSEWWIGDPIFGLFGNAYPHSSDQRQFYSTSSRGSIVSAQRFWLEVLSDIGTVQVGRAPLHWGLGLVWNSGDGIWDRYQTTADTIRLISKFGAFTFIPTIAKYSTGNTIGGACFFTGGACTTVEGSGGLVDYSLTFKYENPDEEFEGGVNFVRRIGGTAQDPASGTLGVGGTVAPPLYNIWDLYSRKKFGRLALGVEVPIVDGFVGGLRYNTVAAALESSWKITDSWEAGLKGGYAPGQPNETGRFRAFFFHPSYKTAFILFNYQFANFAGVQTQNNPAVTGANLASPYDNPIVNALYFSGHGAFTLEKWKFHTTLTYARALETASPGLPFFNSWRRQFFTNNTATTQDPTLGFEWDLGVTFNWDDNFQAHWDGGVLFPGGFHKFSNTAVENETPAVLATAFRVGVAF